MKRLAKSICLIVSLCTCVNTVKAQKTEDLHLQPAIIIKSSVFSKVEVVDTRFDTAHIGFVQRGALNRQAALTFGQSLKDEFVSSITKLIGEAHKEENTILINVRDFFLSEYTGGTSESGKFVFRAGCY